MECKFHWKERTFYGMEHTFQMEQKTRRTTAPHYTCHLIGPSLIIAYAPCINHGLKAKGGMGKSQAEEAKAVECGYWHLWRYNPALADEGKNPFTLDSKEPQWDKFQDYLDGEVRFLSLRKALPEQAQELYDATKAAAQKRYQNYVRKTKEDWSV